MLNISVLLSVYHKENPTYMRQSLNSIFSQTILPAEVVIVKDGPLPDSLNTIINNFKLEYGNILKIVSLPVNRGLGNALHEGLKYCSFNIVARMDTDDIAMPERFEKQLYIFENHLDIDVVGTWVDEFINENSDIVISQRRLPKYPEELRSFAKRRNPINHATVMFRKEAVLAVGGYEEFLLFEDYYLWIKMLLNGSRFYNIQESLVLFRMSLDVYKRRGGWKYAVDECRLRKVMYDYHFISLSDFLLEIPLRFISRIMPSFIRKYLYLYILR